MTPALFEKYESAGAVFDEPKRCYRYSLHRMWCAGSFTTWRTVLWIMLNPSTADEHKLDPTLRRCQAFTRAWGFDGFEVCNLFALRSTDPKALYRYDDPIGPLNDVAIMEAADRADRIICGWGRHGKLRDRGRAVLDALIKAGHEPKHLGPLNEDGTPKHPLYLPNRIELWPMRND